MNIYEKLAAITAELSVVAKNLMVGEGRSSYKAVGEADVLAAVRHLRDTIYYTHTRPGLSSPCCGKTACKIEVWFLRGPELGKN